MIRGCHAPGHGTESNPDHWPVSNQAKQDVQMPAIATPANRRGRSLPMRNSGPVCVWPPFSSKPAPGRPAGRTGASAQSYRQVWLRTGRHLLSGRRHSEPTARCRPDGPAPPAVAGAVRQDADDCRTGRPMIHEPQGSTPVRQMGPPPIRKSSSRLPNSLRYLLPPVQLRTNGTAHFAGVLNEINCL